MTSLIQKWKIIFFLVILLQVNLRVYNYRILRIKESIYVKFNKTNKYSNEEYEFDFNTTEEDHHNKCAKFRENSSKVLDSIDFSSKAD